MGGQQNSPFAAALFQERCGFFHGLRVHAGEGFVQQQGVAPGPEGAEQGRTALLPAGKLVWIGVRFVRQADTLQQTHGFFIRLCLCLQLQVDGRQRDILFHRQMREQVEMLLAKLRNRMPDICLRTTFIVGFPGETEAQFEELLDFAQKEHFQCAGVFTYSQEEETEAGAMKNQIDEATKQERYHRLMALQAKISEEIQQEREGKVLTVLVEGHDEKNPDLAVARSYAEAPDIDGKIFIEGAKGLRVGDFVNVQIDQGFTYEAVSHLVKE